MKQLQRWIGGWLPVLALVASPMALGTDSSADEVDELWERPKWSDQIPMDLMGLWQDIGDRAGFEIGNGRRLIKNLSGQYLVKIYKDWEAGIHNKLTEVISPLKEGIPRARLRINVVKSTKAEMLREILDRKEADKWVPVVLDQLQGLQKETVRSSGIHELEVLLFRDTGEVVMLNMDGTPGKKNAPTAFDKIQSAMSTFQTITP